MKGLESRLAELERRKALVIICEPINLAAAAFAALRAEPLRAPIEEISVAEAGRRYFAAQEWC